MVINITGVGTNFIPGTTVCAEISGGFTSLTISGTASSATEFSGLLTIPPFSLPGSYDVIVYEGPGCSGTSWSCVGCFSICAPFNIFGNPTDASCYQCTDGGVTLGVFGGAFPYTFDWSNGSTDQNLTGVGAGNYAVTIADANGCEAVRDYTINEPEAISVTPINGDPGSTVGLAATADIPLFNPGMTDCVQLSNGTDTYSFTGTASSAIDFNADLDIPMGATPGAYDVSIFSGPGCSGEEWSCVDCFVICDPMTLSGVVTDASCAVCADGSIDLTVSGGLPPFTYNWSNGAMLQDPNGLESGSYSVTVTDAGECTATASFMITEPDPISINPDNGDPGTTINLILTGVGTTFDPVSTTCLELTNGTDTYSITGSADNAILFTADFNLPLGATPGSYDATIYESGCMGTNWACTDCFTVNDILNCGATIYDNGGQFGDYLDNTNDTWTICPQNVGEIVSVLFTSFDIENDGDNCLDELTIWDGDNTGAPVISSPNGTTDGWCWDQDDASMNGSGNLEGVSITSSDPSGCLTFNFSSDGAGTRGGWAFVVQCNQDIVFNPSSGTRGSNVMVEITGFGTNFNPGFTTCAEITMGGETYQMTGAASSATSFTATLNIPLGASQGLYNATIYEGPGCTDGTFQMAAWNCVNCFQVLPPLLSVEWLSFKAVPRATDIQLLWSTATEVDSDYFGVERSQDGHSWEEIGRVSAAGNTTSISEYHLTDEEPLKQNNYYRIRQVDIDGDFSYSEVEVVKFGQEASVIEIYPNPVRQGASLVISSLWSEDIKIKLTDISGKTLQTWEQSVTIGTQVFDLDIHGWPNGVYFISIEGEQNWQPLRFTKIR